MRIFLLILTCLAAAPAYAQQFYSWRDADGVRHFSDSPPAHENYVPRQIRERGQRAAETAETATGAPSSNPACTRARANIAVFANNDSVRMDRNNDGEAELLSDVERAAELDRALVISRRACASP